MKNSNQLNAPPNLPVENDVIADRKSAQVNSEIVSLRADAGPFGKELDLAF